MEPINNTKNNTTLDNARRVELIEELYKQYGVEKAGFARKLHFWRKKYVWIIIIGGAKVLKRMIDIIASTFGFIVLSPIFAFVAISIKLTDKGPILFWQTRVGQYGREFPFPKFRSMVTNAEALKDEILAMSDHEDSITFKMKKDPRVTWIGRIIRKLSIDELPQLWNVLKGDMSLVGPRPPVPREVEQYTLADRRRLDAIPGLTCIWQVSGRGDIPFDEQVKLDVQYIESQSVWFDIMLLLRTVPAVLFGKGAY
jgi:lipopolysaccharide/colanic/teichoic acid biosynthesis glycosyltransferase